MDLNGLLRLIFLEKSDLTVGVLIGLTLLVVVLMLVRSVMEEKQASANAGGVPVDAKALSLAVEGALKKALAVKPLAKTADGTDGEAASADVAELTKTLNAREAKIATLMSDLETVKAQVESKSSGSGGVDNSIELLALTEKVKELQAKLSEYEIIEDDIADLSIFKEENKKLKEEIEKLRAATQTAQVQSIQASVATPSASPEAVQAAVAEIPKDAAATRAPFEPFKLDTEDDVMGEFAQALSGGAAGTTVEEKPQTSLVELPPIVAMAEAAALEATADPFGPVDTDKMLAEVSSMDDGAEVSTSVLEDELDTDRLMAEMGMNEPVTPSAEPESAAEENAVAEDSGTAATAAAPVVEPKPAAASKPLVVEASAPSQDDVPVDDLLAEFKDTDYPTLKGTKGS